MKLSEAIQLSEEIKQLLLPHCERIEVAGSIRRKKAICNDIEIVCIPKPYETGLFESGIATVINQWQKNKGLLPGKYTQRIYKGQKVDIFFADKDNWGFQFAIRTGSADFSHKILGSKWVAAGYKGIDGYLTSNGKRISVPEEEYLFKIINLKYIKPENRNI